VRVKHILPAALAAAVIMLTLTAHPAWAESRTETASAGGVTAELSYHRQRTGFGWCCFTSLRVSILRSHKLVYRSSLYDRACERSLCHPANVNLKHAQSLATRDLDGDREPEVIVDLRLGGAHDICYSIIYRYVPPTYTPLRVTFGDPCYRLTRLDSNSQPEFVTADERVGIEACFACSSFPLLIYRYWHGRLVTVTGNFPTLLRRDAAHAWSLYQREKYNEDAGTGRITAWAGDEYRLGQRSAALIVLHRLVRQGFLFPSSPFMPLLVGEEFVRALDRQLVSLGYGAEPPRLGPYVAVGDSYSSGEGNPPFVSGTASKNDTCHRSLVAFPEFIADDPSLNIISHVSRACSGATRHDVIFGSKTEDSQLNHVSSARLVTISVGGNDIRFGDVVKDCLTGPKVHGDPDCQHMRAQNPDTGATTTLDTREQVLIDDLGKDSSNLCFTPAGYTACSPRLATLYYMIGKASAANLRLVVLLYPHLFTRTPDKSGCKLAWFHHISRQNMLWINHGVDRLDNEINHEVNAARLGGVNVAAVDTRRLFDNGGSTSPGGHGVCTKVPWISGVKVPEVYSFHPNASGQYAIEEAMRGSIENR
jgi:hypothetical protein